MNNRELKLRLTVVLGWCMMFFLILSMSVVDMLGSAAKSDFSAWGSHLGEHGLSAMMIIIAVYAFVPMLAWTITAKWFRGVIVAITVLVTLFYVAHEITHLLTKEVPFGVRHILDFGHHILGIWVTVTASKWVMIPKSIDQSVPCRKSNVEGKA